MSSKYGGYAGRVLEIDLTNKSTKDYPWSDRDREMYLGGKIMAAKIIHDNIDDDIEPLSSENIVVVSTGPLTGSGAPSSGRFNISSISPLTGLLASSNCGGSFGFHLKRCGYDAIIIRGASNAPLWIEIKDDEIRFNDATDIWGKETSESQDMLPVKGGKLVIGPAGENGVLYAGIFSQERAAGRAGLGAVLGHKGVKAITATGTKRTKVKSDDFKEFNKKWIKMLKEHPITGKQLPTYGTAGLVSTMQAKNILATKNFSRGRFDEFDDISGETLREKHLIKNYGCITCPIQCGRKVRLGDKVIKGPELETIGLLGANIENSSLENIIKWNYELDELGMDTISAAGTIAFAMELSEKGLLDTGLSFGDSDNISDVIHDIAYRRGIGDELAMGSKRMSEKYGGKEFAIHSKGLELSAYEPRSATGQGLGYAMSNRGGCHLNGGYMVLFEALSMNMDPFTTKNKSKMTMFTQDIFESISASGCCLFTSYTMLPGLILNNPRGMIARVANKVLTTKVAGFFIGLLNRGSLGAIMGDRHLLPYIKGLRLVTGMNMSYKEFKLIGERGFNLERYINEKRGLKGEHDSLPSRLTDTPIDDSNPDSIVKLDVLKQGYYSSRGWSKEGRISDKTLARLGISGRAYGNS